MLTFDKLQNLLAYISNYVYIYRKKYGLTNNDNVVMKFLANSTPDTLIINCCNIEPQVEVGDFWYNGVVLKKCISNTPQPSLGQRKTYKTIYKYEDGFSTTIVSLNPDITFDGQTTSIPPPVAVSPDDFVRRSGDRMQGPFFLARDPEEDMEAVNKRFLDVEINKLASQDLKINIRLGITEKNVDNLYLALEALNPDATRLNEFIATVLGFNDRLTNVEQSNTQQNNDIRIIYSRLTAFDNFTVAANEKFTDHENRISSLETRISNLENKVSKTSFYTHHQMESDNTWIVAHNQHSVNFIYTIFSPMGEVIIPDGIKVVDADTVVITLAKPAIGAATFFFHV